MDLYPDHGHCGTGEQKIDVQIGTLTNSVPVEESLPARIMARSREVAAQPGHWMAYTVGMDVGSTKVKAVIVDAQGVAVIAFSADTMPVFGYGCSVFMQSDIVNFQRQAWRGEEILAGLAAVLPKNIFLYVAGIPNLAKLGSRFILQGGTQKNLAAVKSEVDFIRSHFHGSHDGPEVIVHEHCGESGAIGQEWKLCAFTRTGIALLSSALTLYRRSAIALPATKIPAATSAKTTAFELSSM